MRVLRAHFFERHSKRRRLQLEARMLDVLAVRYRCAAAKIVAQSFVVLVVHSSRTPARHRRWVEPAKKGPLEGEPAVPCKKGLTVSIVRRARGKPGFGYSQISVNVIVPLAGCTYPTTSPL